MEESFSSIGRVEAIRRLFENSGYEPFAEPLDFMSSSGGRPCSASRLLLEGTDFNLEYFPLKHLGYKAVVAVTGELFSSLSRPKCLSLTLGVSSKLDFPQISQFWQGVIYAAKEFSYQSLSLSLEPSRNGLAISISSLGEKGGVDELIRPKAKSKDLICVSGRLGAAYLGEQVLEKKRDSLEKYKMLVGAYIKPELDPCVVDSILNSTIRPSRGYFVTRGLADAVLRLTRDTALGAKIYADKIPFEGGSFTLGKELDIDPISAAMNGGDDMCLLYTVPIEKFELFRRDFQTFSVIGHLAQSDVGAVLVTPDSLEHSISAQGW